jgi:hypothetical protein
VAKVEFHVPARGCRGHRFVLLGEFDEQCAFLCGRYVGFRSSCRPTAQAAAPPIEGAKASRENKLITFSFVVEGARSSSRHETLQLEI